MFDISKINMPGLDVSDREARDAARLAVQSAIAASGMFILMRSLGLAEEFVGVLSAVLVVQPSVGNTLGEAWSRFSATLVGSAVGVICLIALPTGYGTAAALALSMLVMNAIAGLRPDWRYGVVAAVALSLGADSDVTQTAIDRSIAIGAGVVFGALVTVLIWPDTAEKRAKRHLRAALLAAANRLDTTVEAVRGQGDNEDSDSRRRFHNNVEAARGAINGIRFGDADPLQKRLTEIEKFHTSVVILDRVVEESDDLVRDEDGASDDVDEIRTLACKAARELANGDTVDDARLASIESCYESFRNNVTQIEDDARAHMLRNAVAFGLGEILDSLKAMSDLMNGDSGANAG